MGLAAGCKKIFAWLARDRFGTTATLDKVGAARKWRRGSYGTVGAFGRPRQSGRWFRRGVLFGRV